jgi:hypothetical protein
MVDNRPQSLDEGIARLEARIDAIAPFVPPQPKSPSAPSSVNYCPRCGQKIAEEPKERGLLWGIWDVFLFLILGIIVVPEPHCGRCKD